MRRIRENIPYENTGKGVTSLYFLLQSPKAECSKVGEGEGGGDGDGGGTSPPRSNWVSGEDL